MNGGFVMRLRNLTTPGRLLGLALLIFLAAWPFLGATRFTLHVASLAFIWAVVASYWNLLSGYSGILSLGNLGFFAVGAYVSSVLAVELGISPWITIWIGATAAMLIVTTVLGLPALRLRGIYISLLTLAFELALPSIITLLGDWTGGGIGLLGIPTFLDDIQRWQAYYLTFAFAVVALFVLYRIINGRTGMAFVALRDAEDFAGAIGVDRYREGIKVFAISSFVTGMAGGFFAHTLGSISPGMLSIDQFLMVIAMYMLGGVGTFFGPIIGALVITFGNEYLRVAGSLRLGLIGVLIVLTVMAFPGGIMQLIERVRDLVRVRFKQLKGASDVA
jgi:branched-chain amino acid transport system permease protein